MIFKAEMRCFSTSRFYHDSSPRYILQLITQVQRCTLLVFSTFVTLTFRFILVGFCSSLSGHIYAKTPPFKCSEKYLLVLKKMITEKRIKGFPRLRRNHNTKGVLNQACKSLKSQVSYLTSGLNRTRKIG